MPEKRLTPIIDPMNSKTQPSQGVRSAHPVEPIRGNVGASIIGPTNPQREAQKNRSNSWDGTTELTRMRRILLHLRCLCRDHKYVWHFGGIWREVALH